MEIGTAASDAMTNEALAEEGEIPEILQSEYLSGTCNLWSEEKAMVDIQGLIAKTSLTCATLPQTKKWK